MFDRTACPDAELFAAQPFVSITALAALSALLDLALKDRTSSVGRDDRRKAAGGTLMSRGPQSFRQGDVTKALKGAEKAGKKVQRAEVRPDGSILLDFIDPSSTSSDAYASGNEWDTVK